MICILQILRIIHHIIEDIIERHRKGPSIMENIIKRHRMDLSIIENIIERHRMGLSIIGNIPINTDTTPGTIGIHIT